MIFPLIFGAVYDYRKLASNPKYYLTRADTGLIMAYHLLGVTNLLI